VGKNKRKKHRLNAFISPSLALLEELFSNSILCIFIQAIQFTTEKETIPRPQFPKLSFQSSTFLQFEGQARMPVFPHNLETVFHFKRPKFVNWPTAVEAD
jgi:hypothetical protein